MSAKREPTEAMIDRGFDHVYPREEVIAAWGSMIDAALTPPSQTEE